MATRTPAGMANPSSVPNTSMMYVGWLHDPLRRPDDVRALPIDCIIVGKRERGLDYEKIRGLANSIKTEGLLQPIGVRRTAVHNKYDLIYGFHRLAASSMLQKEDPTEGRIVAVVFPKEMPDWACKLAEIAENLARVDLTQKERESQTLIYAGLLKKNKLVEDADSLRSANAKNRYQKVGEEQDVPHLETQPTLAKKVSKDLGVTPQTFHRHVERGKIVAEKAGLKIERPSRGPEQLTGDELIAIGEKVSQATEQERKEALKGASLGLTTIRSDTSSQVDLDIIDPGPFIAWCRRRIEDKRKPMSINILKAYRKALDELIAEIEGK